MIKLFIVEDETLMRQGIIHMLNWVEHGFVIVGQAANGAEALQQIESTRPDIVITDVMMPVMDGISLTKELVLRYPKLKVIILSSHNDFEFVRDTLRLGACDYILKQEINAENVLVVLKRVAALCEMNSKETLPKIQQGHIFCNLLRTPYQSPEACARIIQQAGIDIQRNNIVLTVFVVSFFNQKDISKDFLYSFRDILLYSCSNLPSPNVFITDNNELLLAYNFESEKNSTTVDTIFSAFIRRIQNEFNISFSALIGIPFSGYENIHSMYQSIMQLEQLTFYLLDEKIFYLSDFPDAFLDKPFDYTQLRSMVEELQLSKIYNII